jgi:hypothetical protein
MSYVVAPLGVRNSFMSINPANVLPELHILIPYAEKWGISDHKLQSKLLREASIEEILEIYEITVPLWDDMWGFTLSHPNPDDPFSYEVNIFNDFRSSLNTLGNILSDAMPERFLEIIGWPENFPPFPFDPAKVPANLQPLAPYIHKWVREDDSIRRVALRVATTAELEGFVAAIENIGRKLISELAVELYAGATAKDEGATLFILLEMGDAAEWELKDRSATISN